MRIFNKSIVLLCVFVSLTFSAFAALEIGPNVGEIIPHDLTLPDQAGEMQSFETLVGPKGMVLVFVRSVDWCPYCQAQLIDLGEQANEITDLGYSLVSLSYDAPVKLAAFSDKYSFEYKMLSDEYSDAISAFGILNTEMQKGTRYYGVPYPGVFIINKQGIIQGKIFEDSYKDRPPVTTITDAIKALRR